MSSLKYFVKFLRISILVLPCYFISGLIKRNTKLWVIGSKNVFIDNSKYFYLLYCELLRNEYDVELVWISESSNTVEKIRKMGVGKAYKSFSLKGIFSLLTAKVYMYSYGASCDLPFFFSRRAFSVYLWHGIGIKNIVHKDNNPKIQRILKNKVRGLFSPSVVTKPDIMLSTSKLMSHHFSECFDMADSNCVVSSYPRCEILGWDKDRVVEFLKKYEFDGIEELLKKIEVYSKVILYMPTWRDDNPDFLNTLKFDWKILNKKLLKKNSLFILKVHPSANLPALDEETNIVVLNGAVDIYSILPFTDTLITDYSSIYFDYLLCDRKEIILFPIDYDDYLDKCRGFAFDYSSHMVGPRIYNFPDLLELVEHGEMSSQEDIKERNKIKEMYWEKNDGAEYFIREIIKRSSH